ncbi:MAG: T9SS type A sorting domain-containing protein [Lewinellaceae bacterium]|nr:T9SS type A sorting domain-containing protein [Phaeodactylibacter sp.]MCB9348064.1 T9SS type A sorting domain-containing protein [Lewinellaceae bacterium]
MKHTLLFLLLFVFSLSVAYSQTSFSDRLSIKSSNNKEKVDLQIFPNPAADYISVTKNEVVKQVTVFNLVGRQMKSFEAIDGEKYYVGDLPRGMYLVQLLGPDSQIITTQRVNKR